MASASRRGGRVGRLHTNSFAVSTETGTSFEIVAKMRGSLANISGVKALWTTTRSMSARVEGVARRAPLAFAFAAAGFLFAAVFTSLEPSFQTNDDPQLAMIASGTGISLQPDEHLVFTNVVIGYALRSMYTAWPWVPWYGLYLYVVQYLAQTAILYCAIAAGYTRTRLALYLLFFATVGVFLLNNLQFTTTASLAGQSGAIIWLLALARRDVASPRQLLALAAAGIGLLVLASLIRLECFYLTAILVVPAAVCLLGWPLRKEVLLSTIGTAAACLGLVLGLAAYNDSHYARDPQWQDFFSYNKLRVKFNDYECTAYTPQTAHVFDAVNWSENDYQMIAHWFYEDPVVYSEVRLRKAIDGYPWQSQRLTDTYWWSGAKEILRDRSLWPVVLVCPLFVFCGSRSGRDRAWLLCCLAVAVVLLAAMAAFQKQPPSRVYFSALTFPLVLSLLMVRDDASLPRWQWRTKVRTWRPVAKNVLVVLTVAGVLLGLTRQYRISRKMQFMRSDVRQLFGRLESRDDHLYVVWAPGFPYQAISPFDNLRSFSNRHQIVLGWPQRTPISDAMRRKFDIEDLPVALYERPNVFLVGRRNIHSLYSKYVEEHHGVKVHFVVEHDGGRDYHLAGHFQALAGSDGPPPADRSARAAAPIADPPSPCCQDDAATAGDRSSAGELFPR